MVPSRIVTVWPGTARPLIVSMTVTPAIAMTCGVCALEKVAAVPATISAHNQRRRMFRIYRFTGRPNTSNRETLTKPPHP
jgi:hypothetical protein